MVRILRLRLRDSNIFDEGTGREGSVILVLSAALKTPVTDERSWFDGECWCCETGGIGVGKMGGCTREGDSCGYSAIRSRL